jgi:hypothetical protein
MNDELIEKSRFFDEIQEEYVNISSNPLILTVTIEARNGYV